MTTFVKNEAQTSHFFIFYLGHKCAQRRIMGFSSSSTDIIFNMQRYKKKENGQRVCTPLK